MSLRKIIYIVHLTLIHCRYKTVWYLMGWSESDFMNFICWNMLVLEMMQKGKYWTIWYASIIALVIWLIRLLSRVYTISSIVQYSRGETSCWPWKTQYFHWYAMKLHVHLYVWCTHVIYVTITCFIGTQKSARANLLNKWCKFQLLQ